MKNFKNLKVTDNIKDVFQFSNKELGSGSFGTVIVATMKQTNVKCALKSIKKESLNQNAALPQLMMSELTVLQKSSHPKIMSVYALYQDDENYYIATELLAGNLLDRIA